MGSAPTDRFYCLYIQEFSELYMTKQLIITVGIPASGKSTLREMYPHMKVVSPDEIRRRLLGVDFDPDREALVWEEVWKVFKIYSDIGEDIYFDATNTTKKRRADVINHINKDEYRIIAHYIKIDVEIAIERNMQRERHVPESVMRSMAEGMEEPGLDEGIDEIRILIAG